MPVVMLMAQTTMKRSGEMSSESKDQRNPEKNERDPQPRHVEVRVLDFEDGDVGNHLRASNARMASAAEISPLFKRSSTSERDGDGLVSTNSSWLEMRFRRALIVG